MQYSENSIMCLGKEFPYAMFIVSKNVAYMVIYDGFTVAVFGILIPVDGPIKKV